MNNYTRLVLTLTGLCLATAAQAITTQANTYSVNSPPTIESGVTNYTASNTQSKLCMCQLKSGEPAACSDPLNLDAINIYSYETQKSGTIKIAFVGICSSAEQGVPQINGLITCSNRSRGALPIGSDTWRYCWSTSGEFVSSYTFIVSNPSEQ